MGLYNGMIAPLMPYGIKGVIWYQGETNRGGYQYETLFPAMIRSWRDGWGQGEFSFYYVQLAGFQPPGWKHRSSYGWAELRDAQFKALRLPNTGMVVSSIYANHAAEHTPS